jgi:hypothetical protein
VCANNAWLPADFYLADRGRFLVAVVCEGIEAAEALGGVGRGGAALQGRISGSGR